MLLFLMLLLLLLFFFLLLFRELAENEEVKRRGQATQVSAT